MARIVILDAHTVNPGDLTWQPLAELGELEVHARTAPELVRERLRGATIAITNKTKLDRSALSDPALRGVAVLATGYNVVDVESASTRGIVVCNAPGYSTNSVVEHTFALLFELSRAVGLHARLVADGEWSRQPDFCFWQTPQLELANLSFGVVGYGAIGQAVARVASALGMKVLATPSRRPADPDVQVVDMDRLFEAADIVSLHCPLTSETHELVNWQRLNRMRPSALLLNTARGGLIRELDLARALENGLIAGAGLDVLSEEPPSASHPLLKAPRCVITPHVAWTTRAARQRLLEITIENVRALLAGTPVNVVNRAR